MLFVAVDGRLGAGPWEEGAAAVPRGASSSLGGAWHAESCASSGTRCARHGTPAAPARRRDAHTWCLSRRSRGARARARSGTPSCVTNDASSLSQARSAQTAKKRVPAPPRCVHAAVEHALAGRAARARPRDARSGANSMLRSTHLLCRAGFAPQVLLWTRKMVENQRRHHTLSPWSGFTEHLLGGAPVPTLVGGEARPRWRHPPRAAARATLRKPAAARCAALTRARAWHGWPQKTDAAAQPASYVDEPCRRDSHRCGLARGLRQRHGPGRHARGRGVPRQPGEERARGACAAPVAHICVG